MLLQIKKLNAGYGKLHILRQVDMEIKTGEMVAFLGPNGAGKSTVLKAIFNLADVYNGAIIYKNKPINKLPTHSLIELGISLVPQGRVVFPNLTVKENLEMGGYLLDHRETREKNLEEVWNYFSILKNKAASKAGELSGGQQQMLAIGRALMLSSELLLLDEPSLGLSPKAMREVFEKIKEINENGVTVVMVEQNVNLALQYVSRGYLLAAGQVRFVGTAEELRNQERMKELYLGN